VKAARAPLRSPLAAAATAPADRVRRSAGDAPLAPPADNILAWWQHATGVTEAGGEVSAWADQGGSGYNATEAGAAKPALNADGSIGFVAGKKLTAAVPNTAQPITLCVRMKASDTLAAPFLGAQGGGAVLYPNGAVITMYAGSGLVGGRGYVVDEWISIVAVFNGADSVITTAEGAGTGNPGAGGIVENAGVSMNDCYFYGGTSWAAAEVILYSAALDAGQIAQALTYLDSINPA